MAIRYDKLIQKLTEGNYTSYTMKKTGLMGQSTYQAVMEGKGRLSQETIDRLCKEFNCQPGDLMEWVPDEEE
ncbi:MAG: helix-turn-helix domain-containing protein [Lacrimispora sp.]|uniref:helix-turn-helix domain-containing protein n=1 Tax=Lacrimispora sp. TaxID=2719234 RepID=UPI00130E3EC6